MTGPLTVYRGTETLRRGWTTGSCAAAASQAAAILLLTGSAPAEIRLLTPGGVTFNLPVEQASLHDGEAVCAVRKDAGDDPDITNGVLISSAVRRADSGIVIDGGSGVGRVTRPGLAEPVGEAAINPGPRAQIKAALERAAQENGYEGGFSVVLSVENGEELALQTYNSHLGIIGGISILGTSGIVEPMSETALLNSIRVEMKQQLALGRSYLVVTLGNYGKHYLDELDYMPIRDTIKCSNYIGEVIDMAVNLGAKGLLFIAHIGKFVKVAGGIMNTHSQNADARSEIMAAAALRAGIDWDGAMRILDTVTTAEAVEIVEEAGLLTETMRILTDKIAFYLQHRCYGAIETEALIFSNEKGALGETAGFRDMLAKIEAEAKGTKI